MDLVRASKLQARIRLAVPLTLKTFGALDTKNRHYQLRQLTLKAGQLQAHGEIDISTKQEVTGKIATKLVLKSRQPQSCFRLSGKLGSVRLNQ